MKLIALSLLVIAAAGHLTSAVPAAVDAGDEDVSPIAPVGECPKVDPPTPVFLRDNESKVIYYVCSHGRPIRMKCPPKTEFDLEQETCVNAPSPVHPVGECPQTSAPYPSFLPDSEDRSAYYVCVAGKPIRMSCPSPLVWDTRLNVCNYEEAVGRPVGECPEEDGEVPALLPDGENCSAYYVCHAGRPFMAMCPAGLVFNSERNYCDFVENVKCPEQEETESQ